MRCQICNRETNNWTKNKQTGEYESICNRCRNAVADITAMYQDMDESVIDADYLSDEDVLAVLREVDLHDSRRTY